MKSLSLYEPKESDFKSYFDLDKKNQARQKWSGKDGYWYWVLKFYNGNTFNILGFTKKVKGWKEASMDIIILFPGSKKDAMMEKLNQLGINIAREWSKDNGIRKINTFDLEYWYRKISKSIEIGVNEVEVCVDSIQNDVNKKYN